ncbi:MAG: glycosyltransferase [Muribaculaceae bacterium]|nr:glycosyltransferase [Muribaculaceae bacterium]
MISVVIPLYNKASFIEETLRSVFNQSYANYEIIVVDDGSTDNGPEIVGQLKNARLRLISQPNSGVSVARNTGIREARGEYIAFLDADDIWKPDYLQTQNDLITRYPQCDVFVTKYEFMNENGQVTPVPINKLPFSSEDGLLTNYFQVAACSYPPIWTGCVVVRKKVFEEIGYFPKGIKLGEDLITM